MTAPLRRLGAAHAADGAVDGMCQPCEPDVPGLGRVFLFRTYRPGLAKWQTADPLGYPDGWTRYAYCGNEIAMFVVGLDLVKAGDGIDVIRGEGRDEGRPLPCGSGR